MLGHAYKIITDCGVRAPEYVIEVVHGLNATYKKFLPMIITTVHLNGAASYASQMEIQTSNSNTDISLESDF